MSITTPSIPTGVCREVGYALGALDAARGRPTAGLAAGAAGPNDSGGGIDVPQGAGLPVYGMAIADLLADKADPLTAARPIGWRMLISDGDGFRLVDRLDHADRDAPTVTIISGPSVDRFGAATRAAEQDAERPRYADRTFEPRILDLGRLGINELWMHCVDGEDMFYPLTGTEPVGRDTQKMIGEAIDRAQQKRGGTPRSDEGGGAVFSAERDDCGG